MSKPIAPAPSHVHGTFTVALAPQPHVDDVGDAAISRLSIDKQFFGELDGVSKGQMIAFRSATAGSAGYVAMERVVGALHGRRGSFVLQHSSTMNRNTPTQSITVVPDSGTDELIGLTGSMTITIIEKQHYYDFTFTIAE